MKKVADLVRPNILLILGALLFLYYMNWLSYGGAGLAIGIVAVVCAGYCLVAGILGVVMGDKVSPMAKKIFDTIAVVLFAAFMFTFFLLFTIERAKIEDYMGPTAWIIAVFSMAASLFQCVIYPTAKFVDDAVIRRLATLFSILFALTLLLNVLFNPAGTATTLGAIDVILTVIYAAFIFFLFDSLGKPKTAPVTVYTGDTPAAEPDGFEAAEAPAQDEEQLPL